MAKSIVTKSGIEKQSSGQMIKGQISKNMKRLSILLAAVVYVFCRPGSISAFDQISISGYYKNYFTAIDRPNIKNLPDTPDQPLIGAVNNRLRLNLFGRANERMSLTLAYDFSPRVQDASLFDEQPLSMDFNPPVYRAADFDSRLYPDEDEPVSSFAVFNDIDRAYFTISYDMADIYLGRQAIAWGSARVINPTDIFTPYAFNELDVEDRPGTDAIRVRAPISFMGEIDAGYIFGEDFEFDNSAIFLRSRFYYRRTDIALIVAGFRENLLMGFDLTRSIVGAGFWVEGGYVIVDALDGEGRNNGKDYFRSSMGVDYSLRDGTYLFAEYHFNQAGASEPSKYLPRLEEAAYKEGSVYLLGKHYLAPGISYQATPLIIISGEALVNLTDPSLLLAPQVEYDIAQDIYLSAGAYLGSGKSPVCEFNQGYRSVLRLRSEFGGYSNLIFTSFHVYF
jgi:hypothetical protein